MLSVSNLISLGLQLSGGGTNYTIWHKQEIPISHINCRHDSNPMT